MRARRVRVCVCMGNFPAPNFRSETEDSQEDRNENASKINQIRCYKANSNGKKLCQVAHVILM